MITLISLYCLRVGCISLYCPLTCLCGLHLSILPSQLTLGFIRLYCHLTCCLCGLYWPILAPSHVPGWAISAYIALSSVFGLYLSILPPNQYLHIYWPSHLCMGYISLYCPLTCLLVVSIYIALSMVPGIYPSILASRLLSGWAVLLYILAPSHVPGWAISAYIALTSVSGLYLSLLPSHLSLGCICIYCPLTCL